MRHYAALSFSTGYMDLNRAPLRRLSRQLPQRPPDTLGKWPAGSGASHGRGIWLVLRGFFLRLDDRPVAASYCVEGA
jgi:hypothetical protein